MGFQGFVMTSMLRPIALFAALALAALTGCVVVEDDDGHHHDDDDGHGPEIPPPQQPEPFYATIDRGATLTTDLGYGAGLFVEYAEGGQWTLWSSCDSYVSQASCFWRADVIVHDADIATFDGLELEDGDYLTHDGANLSLDWVTSYESDAVTFTTEPGALVEVHLYLDGISAPGYFVWYGNGDVQDGAPSNPVVFQPDAP